MRYGLSPRDIVQLSSHISNTSGLSSVVKRVEWWMHSILLANSENDIRVIQALRAVFQAAISAECDAYSEWLLLWEVYNRWCGSWMHTDERRFKLDFNDLFASWVRKIPWSRVHADTGLLVPPDFLELLAEKSKRNSTISLTMQFPRHASRRCRRARRCDGERCWISAILLTDTKERVRTCVSACAHSGLAPRAMLHAVCCCCCCCLFVLSWLLLNHWSLVSLSITIVFADILLSH